MSTYYPQHLRQLRQRHLPYPHRMLNDLEAGVDRTENKLGGAMKRMKKFIRDTEGVWTNPQSITSRSLPSRRNKIQLVYSNSYSRIVHAPCCCCIDLRLLNQVYTRIRVSPM
jgi:hypothetical protein